MVNEEMGDIKTKNRVFDRGQNRGNNKFTPKKSKLTAFLFKPVQILAIFALAFTLTACGGAKTDTGSSSGNTNTGDPSVAVSASPYTGNVCPNGGITVETGIDENSNGILDTGEVDETQIVCNGTNGTNGTDGTSIAISLTNEPVGSNCANGGIKIEAGVDDNGNGVLDIPGEVDDTDYVCNGSDGSGYASLQGTITLSGQSDHSGITVSLAGTGFSTTTDATGAYTLTNIPSGAYNIVFDAPTGSGYETGATLYGYRLFAGIDDYDLTNADLQLGRGILLSEISRESGYYSVLISPDSSRVVYKVYSSDDLYSVPIGGGAPILLTSNVYNDYYSVLISPDSTRVVYRDSSDNLYSVPIGGGTPTLLASNVYFSDYSYSVEISPDSSRVVYTDSSSDLYSIPIGGGTPTLLASNVYFSNSSSVEISPDSSLVVYTDYSDYSSDLYSVPIGGGTPTLLASGAYYSDSVQISPDSSLVVYTDYSSDLYSVPIGGGSPILLASNVYSYSVQISPDSTRVIFTDSDDYGYSGNLYTVQVSGGTPVMLASDVSSSTVQISPDSAYVIFTDNDGYGYSGNLYTVQVSGGTPVMLASDVSSYSVEIAPNSAYVIFRDDGYDSNNLYTVPIGGGSPTQLASDLHYSAQISPDSTTVVYVRSFGAETNYYEGYSFRLLAAPLP